MINRLIFRKSANAMHMIAISTYTHITEFFPAFHSNLKWPWMTLNGDRLWATKGDCEVVMSRWPQLSGGRSSTGRTRWSYWPVMSRVHGQLWQRAVTTASYERTDWRRQSSTFDHCLEDRESPADSDVERCAGTLPSADECDRVRQKTRPPYSTGPAAAHCAPLSHQITHITAGCKPD